MQLEEERVYFRLQFIGHNPSLREVRQELKAGTWGGHHGRALLIGLLLDSGSSTFLIQPRFTLLGLYLSALGPSTSTTTEEIAPNTCL